MESKGDGDTMNLDQVNQRQHEEERPNPEELLERYHLRDSDLSTSSTVTPATDTAQPQKRQGRLRIYLGAAAGVGKTYAMLNEGRRQKGRGTDVVVGYVDTHERPQTQAQLGDLEVLPRKQMTYRNILLEEMDTKAILARHPQVALVDELAHTNAPGCKHQKRYQDVQELLDAGIDVVATLNVQHLESLNDLVASITGIKVHETLPDRILDQADEVELIDIAPHALQQRLQSGNIYPASQIETALHNFFREGNLTALRELALRLTAQKTEAQLQQYMTEHAIQPTWQVTERVLVGFDHRPQSRRVIRDAWRLAHGLDADLIALHIELEGFPAWRHNMIITLKYGKQVRKHREEAQRRLEEHALLAEDLGAEVIRIRSRDIASTMVQIARERHITQLVLGQPARSRWEEILRGSVINQIVRLDSELDIHLVPLHRESKKEA